MTLQMKPEWNQIDEARNRCNSFLESRNYPSDVREALCMITSEFLENAVKYGVFKSQDETVPVRMEVRKDAILMEVKSPLDQAALSTNMRKLDSIVQWIRGFQSPFQAYLERLKLVAGQPMDDEESGLGLVRIAYEGEAILDFYVDENDTLSISAIFPVTRKPEV